MTQLRQDLVYAFRLFARDPLVTIAIVLLLALGIGATTAMISVVDAVLLRPLPYPGSDRLTTVYASSLTQGAQRGPMSQEDYLRMRPLLRSFDAMAAYAVFGQSLMSGPADPQPAEQLVGGVVSADFFSVVGITPLYGRGFVTGEDQPGAARVAVISEDLWRNRYNGRPDVLGSSINLSGKMHTVVGVMSASFGFPRSDVQVWLPIVFDPEPERGALFLRGIARLAPGATLEGAQAELDGVAKRLGKEYPQWYSNVRFPVVSLHDAVVGDTRQTLWMIQGVVAFVLLIAIANIGNLLLARASARLREVTIRTCLGATRARIVRQFCTENVALSIVGALASFAVASATLRYLSTHTGEIPRLNELRIGAPVFAVTLGLGVVCAALFGIAPTLHGSRAELGTALKLGSRGTTHSRSSSMVQAVLIVSQIALCFVLLIGAGLLVKSAVQLNAVTLGFETPPDQLLTMQIYPTGPRYTPERRAAVQREIVERVKTLPGVQAAAIAASVPPERWTFREEFHIEGTPLDPHAWPPAVTIPTCTPDYFATMGIPLLKGRLFTAADSARAPRVAIVSQTLARRYFPNENPLGKRIRRGEPEEEKERPYMEIVGVVGDVRYNGLRGEPEAVLYDPLDQEVPRFWTQLVIRSAKPLLLINGVRNEIRSIDKDITVSKITTIGALVTAGSARVRFCMLLLSAFAVLSVFLSAMGVYAMISYSVSRRTTEMAVRLALGASRLHVLGALVGRAVTLGLAGLIIGGAMARVVTRLLENLLFGVTATDALTFGNVAAVLLGVVLLASYLPARRAVGIDPALALREATT